jgi:prefoldin beta subunit
MASTMEAQYEKELLEWKKLQKGKKLSRTSQIDNQELYEMSIDLATLVSNRQQLESQLKENEMVLSEMILLKEESNTIYKLIGPVLVKQELSESRHNVEKRIEFIRHEL